MLHTRIIFSCPEFLKSQKVVFHSLRHYYLLFGDVRKSSLFHICEIFTRHGITFVRLEEAEFREDVKVVFNCYYVVPTNPDVCKSEISGWNCVMKSVII